jgi:hypothetical protein
MGVKHALLSDPAAACPGYVFSMMLRRAQIIVRR